MIKKKVAEIDSLTGGLDTFINATEIEDSATPDCVNVIPVGKGAFKTRLGRSAHGGEITNGYSGQGYFTYINSSGAYEELVVANGVLKRKNGNSWTSISGGTFSTSNRVFAVQLGDRLYFADGVTALCYYDGSNIVTTGVASAPLPSFLITFGRRLYCNDVNNPDRVYFGGALTAAGASTDTGNFASDSPSYGGYLGFGKGKIVTGLGKLGASHLVVGLKDALHRLSPTSGTGTSSTLAHTEESISNSVGISSHTTVDNIENDLGFLSWADFYLLGEVASFSSIRTRVISTKVSSLIQGISDSMVTKTCGIYSPVEKKYYLAYADGTSYNNKVLVYDTYYKSWWKFDNWHPASWIEYVDSSNTRFLGYVSDHSTDSYCYEINIGSDDNGTAISWRWKSKVLDLKGFDVLKKFKRWAALFGPVYGVVTTNVDIDDQRNTTNYTIGTASNESSGLGTTLIGRSLLGMDTNETTTVAQVTNDYRWKKIARPNEGTRVQIEFSGSGRNYSGQIEKIKFYYQENKLKKDRTKRLA